MTNFVVDTYCHPIKNEPKYTWSLVSAKLESLFRQLSFRTTSRQHQIYNDCSKSRLGGFKTASSRLLQDHFLKTSRLRYQNALLFPYLIVRPNPRNVLEVMQTPEGLLSNFQYLQNFPSSLSCEYSLYPNMGTSRHRILGKYGNKIRLNGVVDS